MVVASEVPIFSTGLVSAFYPGFILSYPHIFPFAAGEIGQCANESNNGCFEFCHLQEIQNQGSTE